MAAFIKTSSDRLYSVLPTHTFNLHDQQSDSREMAEQAVKNIFRQVYQADIGDFSPLLITAQRQERIDAVIGLRNAGQEPLFLESYLDNPIEQVVEQRHGLNINRHNFLELGNLVALRTGASRQMFIVLAYALAKAGIKWVTFTATAQVKRLLGKLGLIPIEICKAQHQAVINGDSKWGSYYDDPPTVCFGNVKKGIEVLEQIPTVSAIFPSIEASVNRLADQISKGFSYE